MNRYQIRKSKLEKTLIQALNQIILFEMEDLRLKTEMITLSRVEINNDFSQLSVFFTCYNPEKKNKTMKILYQSIPYFRSLLAQKVMMKSIPQLKFFYDHQKEEKEDVVDLIDRLSAQYQKKSTSDNS